jgi:hypothetical protein
MVLANNSAYTCYLHGIITWSKVAETERVWRNVTAGVYIWYWPTVLHIRAVCMISKSGV